MAKKLKRGKPSSSDLKNGLSALFPGQRLDKASEEETIKALSRNFAMLPIDKVSPNPDQPRQEFEKESLKELADSIRVHGIIQPMTVRHMGDGSYQIISGERRFRASQMAGLREVPAFIRTANDQTLLEMALIENIQREDLNPMEVAYSYLRLQEEFDLTQEELARRVGKKRSTITNYLTILSTSNRVRQAIKDRKISIGAAKTFSGIKDIGQQETFLDDILSHPNWSVRDIERESRVYKNRNKISRATPPSNDDARRVEQSFAEFFGTKKVKVKLDNAEGRSGTVTLRFESKEQLDQFYKAVE
ncbi:ParB/RepB/Spo0J family partition protein [Lewinella sp. IMCC34191]|uniref:ParB/RepB/Spo0J family partition protein n=1 Tax=Lewinella sp. IMCC34191 TaxID=2259172 RepID=UPI000E229E53|nr:ParB/RepB/Spo0J family partition protein [Lewinella sp. IMCC34191]